MRMIVLSALLAAGLGFAATTGASAAPAANGLNNAVSTNTSSPLQDVAVRCRRVTVCRRGPYGRRCHVERVCRRYY